MWASLAPWSRSVAGTAPGVTAVEIPAQRAGRVILRWRGAAGSGRPGALVTAAGLHGRVVVEDSFGDLVARQDRRARDGGVTVDRMPLMLRPAGGAAPPGNGATVVLVTDQEALVQAERVIVDGFPRPALQPYRPGRMLPPQVLTTAGWRTWLAYRAGRLSRRLLHLRRRGRARRVLAGGPARAPVRGPGPGGHMRRADRQPKAACLRRSRPRPACPCTPPWASRPWRRRCGTGSPFPPGNGAAGTSSVAGSVSLTPAACTGNLHR